MIRRISCIVLVIFTRLACLAGRLAAGEPGPGHTELVPMPTMGGKQFWGDELFFHQWRIQRNVFTGHCRLLDGRDFRYAWGTYQECEAALDRIKQDRHLPKMQGKAVVVLHGLVRTHSSMDSLCRCLQKKGGYQVFNVEYPSTQRDIGEIAKSLRHIVNHLDGIEEINFVGHSMGNIVIRHYLGDLEGKRGQAPFVRSTLRAVPANGASPLFPAANEEAADRRAKARFGRFVMLGPPNQGARLAEVFADNALFKQIAGDAGRQLGVDWPQLEKRLATPTFEFGIIAGGRNGPKGYNPMLAGDNDGVIGVETAKLDGARDFIVVPVLHSFLMDDAKVQQYALHFIEHGSFISENERHALGKGAPEKAKIGKRGQAPFVESSLRAVTANGACPLFPGVREKTEVRK
jgi:pimeloyl-ACP methyl ester carboxylesterase